MTRARRPVERPLIRRDAAGKADTAPSWESLTERLIREAQEAGEFDDLPDRGQPLDFGDDVHAGDMAGAHHVLRNAGALPLWIAIDMEARRQRARIDALLERATRSTPAAAPRLSRDLELHLVAHDDAVRQLETLAPTPRQQRRRLDRDELHERLVAALETRHGIA